MANTALNRTGQLLLTNKSGGAVAQGDVVIVDTANAAAFTTTTTSAYVSGTIGVVIEPNGIADSTAGMVAVQGYVSKINLSGTGSIGDLIKTHTVAKQGVRNAAPVVTGNFAQALGTSATPVAILWGITYFGSGSGVTRSGATTDAHLAVWNGSSADSIKDGGVVPTGGYTQGCRVYNSTNITVANNSDVLLTFNSERYDTDTMHDTSSNQGRITFTTAGTYYFNFSGQFAANATGVRSFWIMLNETTRIASVTTNAVGSSIATEMLISGVYAFTAGQYIIVHAYQSTGGDLALNAAANYSPEFMAQRIG